MDAVSLASQAPIDLVAMLLGEPARDSLGESFCSCKSRATQACEDIIASVVSCKHITEEAPPLRELRPDASPALEHVIRKAMSKERFAVTP